MDVVSYSCNCYPFFLFVLPCILRSVFRAAATIQILLNFVKSLKVLSGLYAGIDSGSLPVLHLVYGQRTHFSASPIITVINVINLFVQFTLTAVADF